MPIQRRNAIKLMAFYAVFASSPHVFAQGSGLDHSYAGWDALLQKHVKWLPDGKQSRMDYRALAADRAALQAVLAQWSAVTPAQFATFSREQQMVFLINAYNGFTAELILTKYPNLKSIKDAGSLLQSPWKNKFFTLLGEQRHLDWIEHEQLRPNYNDPRVHAAVNCASIGCPALRPDAFTPAKLDAQLTDGMLRFMSDRSRNRYNAQSGKLEVSAIFKWFREDFEKGQRGFAKLEDVFAFYADQLTNDAATRDKLRAKTVSISFLDYDWSLNDTGR
ncbi:DUF547 domain-containing protein [Rhodoferax sp.]|uniref:DUF547 domain-containing protein n=1 Tax=Rhodoferax sp. TaxID=50421 RepID=UPI0025D77438|nr:DUF547 domain-containing protein [Rhodoferax sp.]